MVASAPLTTAQTVAICRHLQTQIHQVEEDADESKRVLQHTSAHVQGFNEKIVGAHDDIQSLKLGFAEMTMNMQKIQAESGRIFEAVVQLQMSDQNSKDKVGQLEENKKMVDARLDVISKDIAHEGASGKSLRAVIETKVNEDMRIVLKDMASTRLKMDQLKEQISLTAEAEKQDHDSLRQAHERIDGVLNEMKKANTVTNIIENRLASTAKGVQSNWTKCAELDEGLQKLTDCYDKAENKIATFDPAIRAVSDAGKKTKRELDESVRQVAYNSDRLDQALRALEEEGQSTMEARHEINTLRQNCDSTTRRIGTMQKEMIELQETGEVLRAALKESNSTLLPNIQMDSQTVQESHARHGSLLMGGDRTRSSGFGMKTPRSREWA